ncbi:MAG TPA: 2-hydroxyacyl-CoA dehydratase family protein [Thermoguttaceae bacterium]|nr:2-hydroxyacyl-CoA dehydratase family protein [Thermoguttaceae bacterium]
MDNVGYFSPFVPPEWIAAHGVRPVWLTLDRTTAHTHDATHRGICPCAAALVANAMSKTTPEALVLTTVCDQMRYASAYLDTRGDVPAFLLNVPSTWQSPQARRLYREELERLGRFLVQVGGRKPTDRQLDSMIERYDDRRTAALKLRPETSARRWAEMLVDLRGDLTSGTVEGGAEQTAEGIPLGVIGGPLPAEDDAFLDLVAQAGGRIVVDASEGGERTLPALVDRRHLKDDPLDELVRIYFDTIPDVFRRPNTRLYEWLGEHLSAHSVRGIILRRYPFCDLWHAELYRLRQWSDVPVLDVDVATGEEGESSRTLGRIEAFLEMF